MFSDGSSTNWGTADSAGQVMNTLATSGQWVQRTVDLSAFANKTAVSMWLAAEGITPPGDWDEYYADVVINTADGRVIPVYNGQSGISLTSSGWGAMTNLTAGVHTAPDTGLNSLHYFLDDHLGTTQVEVGASGVPLWLGQFTPFGQELPDGFTAMHYKFTGKERDAESGLDYFGARYYASSMGRWMSPDWSAKAEPVPYSKLDDPQTLNLYGYVRNNPLWKPDIDGHGWLSDSWNKIKTDAVAAIKTVSVTVEVGVGLKAQLKEATGDAHIGVSVHGEVKLSKHGEEATVKAEADAGIKANGATAGGEAGIKTTSGKDGMINGVKPYAESEGGVAVKEREGTSNGEEYSYGGAAYTPDGGGGAHVSISKEAVDKVIDDVGEALSHAIEPKKN